MKFLFGGFEQVNFVIRCLKGTGRLRFALAALPFLFCWSLASARQDLIVPPNGLWVTPVERGGVLYGASSESANWHVSQWNSPSKLGNFDQDGVAIGENQRISIRDGRFEMEADGEAVPCNLEFDTFFGSNNKQGMYKGVPSAILTEMPLSAMQSLMHTIALTPLEETDRAAGCQQRKAVYVTSITLRNDTTGSTFFYQLRLRKYRASPKPFWWDKGSNGKRYGYGDNLQSFGIADVSLGQRRLISVDLLPRIRTLLLDDEIKIDRDLSHWRVGATYHGVAIWGAVRVKARWDSFSLYALP